MRYAPLLVATPLCPRRLGGAISETFFTKSLKNHNNEVEFLVDSPPSSSTLQFQLKETKNV
jgi:hypothetical protein